MQILIVIDMQNDFIDGALGTEEAKQIVPAVCEKIRAFQETTNGIVFSTRDTHDPQYLNTQEGRLLPVPHCIRGTDGWQIHPQVARLLPQEPIDKPTFGSPVLASRLTDLAKAHPEDPIERITLIGLCTDICVISNAMLIKAALPEVPIHVDPVCCAGVTPERHENALKAMAACQIQIDEA